MKPEIVCQAVVTNSDNSFDTVAATDSRDEDDESQTCSSIDKRDQADEPGGSVEPTSKTLVDTKPAVSPSFTKSRESGPQTPVSIPLDGRDNLHSKPASAPPTCNNLALESSWSMSPCPVKRDEGHDHGVVFFRRSPTAILGTPQAKNRDDTSTFSLFEHSFDSVSQTTDLRNSFALSPTPRKDHCHVDISLPALSHYEEQNISPIKIDLDHHDSNGFDPFAYDHRDYDFDQHQCQSYEHRWENPAQSRPQLRPYGYDENRNEHNCTYSNPVFVLRSCRDAFRECTFVLSHVQVPNPLSVNCSSAGSFHRYNNSGNIQSEFYDPHDLVVACRRVKSAVCAFGGSMLVAPHRGRASIFRGLDHWNAQYETRLHKRYHLSGSQISWDCEEHPPIYVDPNESIQKKDRDEVDEVHLDRDGSSHPDGATPSPSADSNEDQTKMRYRCKLCGQPKQNHSCPYRQAMQRNIGVSVYPVVNAYTASEPGNLAPALAEMNNFIDRFEDGIVESARFSQHPSHSSEMTPPFTGFSKKRKHSETFDPEPLVRQVSPFAQTESLSREQYRAVSTPTKDGDFEYPPIPLTFSERKKLSDTLFTLSKEIHYLNEEVASILHDARERNLWDVAVAQVMTQVIVALYCVEGDKRLDGLHHYLLGIGISC